MPFYIMHCFTRIVDFSHVFPRTYDAYMLVSKTRGENARKMQEKHEKNPKREPNVRKCFYIKALLHFALYHWSFIFSRVFPRVNDTNMLVSKTREKREKNLKRELKA